MDNVRATVIPPPEHFSSKPVKRAPIDQLYRLPEGREIILKMGDSLLTLRCIDGAMTRVHGPVTPSEHRKALRWSTQWGAWEVGR